MSFILDAIARSERERQQREAAPLRALATPEVPVVQTGRRTTVYIATAILLINAVVLTLWMQTWHDEPVGVAPASAPAVATDQPPELRAPVVETAPAPGVVVANSVSPNTSQPVSQTIATTSGSVTVTSVAQSESVASVENTNSVRSTTALQNELTDETSDWVRIGPDTLASKTQSQPANRIVATGAPAQTTDDLPSEVRQALPTVVFSGHLYSRDQASSLVFVDDGRPVTPGQRVTGDVFLNEITPDGVVVEFRGYLISVGVLQNWTLN